MIKDYNQTNGTGSSCKKKLLAPLIIIALCMISITGGAYAYSTSVIGQGEISGNYYSIDMYQGEAGNYAILNASLSSEDKFVVETTKIVGSNYFASVDETSITFNTKVKLASDDSSDYTFSGHAQYMHNSSSADMFSAWSDPNAVTCDVEVLGNESDEYYDVEITVILPEIDSVDLGTSDPRDIAEKVYFNGTNCISIALYATE